MMNRGVSEGGAEGRLAISCNVDKVRFYYVGVFLTSPCVTVVLPIDITMHIFMLQMQGCSECRNLQTC
jgi:hypothetical protein